MVHDDELVTISLFHPEAAGERDTAKLLHAAVGKEGWEAGHSSVSKLSAGGEAGGTVTLLWFVSHPEVIGAVKDIFVGSTLVLLGYWLKGDSSRKLRIKYGFFEVEAKSIDELKEAMELLPPPSTREIVNVGEKLVEDKAVSKDDNA